MSYSMNSPSVGAELVPADGYTHVQTDGRTDMTKLIVAFRNFVNVPKSNESCCGIIC